MRKTFFILAIAAVVISLCSCAGLSTGQHANPSTHLKQISQRGELVVGTTGNMPPLNMVAKEGEIIGLEVDMAKIMANEMQVALRIKTMPFHELLPSLEKGDIDMVISGMTITSARNMSFAFAGPYMASGKSLLAKIETIANATSPTELNSPDVTLTALKGSTSQEFVETLIPKAQFKAADTYDEAVQLILDDKAHAMVADFPICVASQLRYPDAGFIYVNTPLTYEPYGIALPPGDAHLLNWVENFLQTLEDGKHMDLLERKWLKNGKWINRVW